jgi:hypothetical protein
VAAYSTRGTARSIASATTFRPSSPRRSQLRPPFVVRRTPAARRAGVGGGARGRGGDERANLGARDAARPLPPARAVDADHAAVLDPGPQNAVGAELDVADAFTRQPRHASPGAAAVAAPPDARPPGADAQRASGHGERVDVPPPLPARPKRREMRAAVRRAKQRVVRRDVERRGIARIDLEDVERLQSLRHARPRRAPVGAAEDRALTVGVEHVRVRGGDGEPAGRAHDARSDCGPRAALPADDAVVRRQVDGLRTGRVGVEVVDARASGRVGQRRPRAAAVRADEDALARVRLQVDGRGKRRRQLERQDERVGGQAGARMPPAASGVRGDEDARAVRPREEARGPRRVELERRDGPSPGPVRDPSRRCRPGLGGNGGRDGDEQRSDETPRHPSRQMPRVRLRQAGGREMPPAGIEPAAYRLGGGRSIH